MVQVKQISRMIALCNNAGQTSLSKELNRIRGMAFGYFGDYTYECEQAIESYPNCPKDLVAALNEIMYNYEEAIKWCKENAPESVKNLHENQIWDILKDRYFDIAIKKGIK